MVVETPDTMRACGFEIVSFDQATDQSEVSINQDQSLAPIQDEKSIKVEN